MSSLILPDAATESVIDVVGTRAAMAGFDYYRAGRVGKLERSSPEAAKARVRGAGSRFYEVVCYLVPPTQSATAALLGGRCSCPVQQSCKHVAATYYALAYSDPDLLQGPVQTGSNGSSDAAGVPQPQTSPAGPAAARAKRPTAAADGAKAAHAGNSAATWLQAVLNTVAPTAAHSEEPDEHVNFSYRLRPTAQEQAQRTLSSFVLEIYCHRRTKSGELKEGKRIEKRSDWSHFAHTRHAAHRHLRDCLKDYEAATSAYQYYGDATPTFANPLWVNRGASAVFRAAVLTGHSTWGQSTEPLRWQPDTTAALHWRLLPDGRQTLQLDVPQSYVLLSQDPCCYVDTRTQRAGRLRLPFPEALLRLLEFSPALAMHEVEPFSQTLPEVLKQVLPLPRRFEQVIKDVAPLPVLQLCIDADPETGKACVMGALKVRYGEQLVRPHRAKSPEAPAPVHVQTDNVLTVMPRHVESEESFFETLLQRGCRRLAAKAAQDSRYDVVVSESAILQEFYSMMESRLLPLKEAGWRLLGLKELEQTIVHADGDLDLDLQQQDTGSPWFSLDMGIEIDGKRHDLLPILLSALQQPEFDVPYQPGGPAGDAQPQRIYLPLGDNRVLSMPAARLHQVLDVVQEMFADKRLGVDAALRLLQLADTGVCRLHGGSFILEMARKLRDCQGVDTVKPPRALKAELRHYQLQGLSWLQFLRQHDLAGILADDMGLGKTLQTLAHILYEKQHRRLKTPALVVLPTSLLFNWQQEAARFTPSLRLHAFYGPQRYDEVQALTTHDVVLTTYGVLLRDIEVLEVIPFHLLILDESQAIKNPRSQVHKVARRLQGKHRLCLSGTPMQNNLEELWAHFAFLMPELLESHKVFTEEFRTPIEKHSDVHKRGVLTRRLKPFLLRRTKSEVTSDLPPKTEIVQKITLAGKQRDLYEAVRAAVDEQVRHEIANRGLKRSTIAVLDALLKLRQVCCDPRLVPLAAAKKVQQSAKLAHLLSMLPEMVAEGRKILLFSQFTSMLDLIVPELQARNIASVMLTGKTQNRQKVVEAFQTGSVPLFLISLKAGGVGLNLTQADTVIHYDPWWNPAAEAQATDRAHRIGQDKNVFVYKLIVSGSVEEKILELQQRKRQLHQAVLGTGQLAELFTKEDLTNLFAPLT
jgi:hypothetical protein